MMTDIVENTLNSVESPLTIKQDYTLNEAQSMLMAMGIRPELIFAHFKERTYSYTKRGPGRVHKQGKAD